MELESIESKIIQIQGQQVILDSDIAELYGVETKRINEAVRNNPDKFPEGYILELSSADWHNLKSKISTSSWGGVRKPPNSLSEKGLYMLATILKSAKATETTIAIIETFAKIRGLSRSIAQLPEQPDKEQQKSLMRKSSELIMDILGDDFQTVGTETTVEFNFSVLKVKHTIKKKSKE